ncbi:MAG: sulfatase-like hydrolase/transferase [Lachnospiraceae bacterium]|nr:sulfatase-like hydrolase/transferase [Lachnospiraceae bacterium]
MIEYPLRHGRVFRAERIKGSIAGYGITAFLDSLFCLIFGYSVITLGILTGVFFVFGVVNYFIYRFHGTPFTVGEVKNFRTAMAVAGSYSFVMPLKMAAGEAVLLLCAVAILVFNKDGSFSRLYSLGLLGFFAIIVFLSFFSPRPFVKKKLVIRSWEPVIDRYGYIPPFLRQTVSELKGPMEKPEGYDREKTKSFIEDQVFIEDQKTEERSSGRKPDIIFILNETFYDMGSLTDIKADRDVLENYRSIEGAISGRTVAARIGGGTNVSEYECLTANSMDLMSHVATPFNVVNLNGANTVLTYLKSMGYKTCATHPGETFSYRRNVAYPAMGFDGITFGKDYKDPGYYGHRTDYITDSSMYDNLIRWYEEAASGDDPVFFYGLTIQNHGDWNVNPEDDIIVHSGRDFGKYTRIVNEFLSCISLSDEAFLKLTEYFKKTDRDVVIVMTGDHSPSFVNERDFRDITGTDDLLKLCSTPYIIWSNRELARPAGCETISMPFLLPVAFEAAGMKLSPYMDFLTKLRQEVPVFPGNDEDVLPEEKRELLSRYYSFEYLNYSEPNVTREFWLV